MGQNKVKNKSGTANQFRFSYPHIYIPFLVRYACNIIHMSSTNTLNPVVQHNKMNLAFTSSSMPLLANSANTERVKVARLSTKERLTSTIYITFFLGFILFPLFQNQFRQWFLHQIGHQNSHHEGNHNTKY